MRAVFGLVLILGLGLAGFAVYMVQGYFENQQAELARQRAAMARQVPTVEVYAVTRNMAFGEQITPEDVRIIRYAEPYLPEGVFRDAETLFPDGIDRLRIVTRPMEANEPVLASKVTEPGRSAGITTQLAPGMRAFTISVDVTSGVSGFLRPGDRVDVYWTGQPPGNGGRNGEVTRLIDTNLKLIAVDQTSDGNRSEISVARTVTVEVSPQQVANLAQAQATGSLSLSLVGYSDDTVAQSIEVTQRSLLGMDDEPEPVEVEREIEPEVCTIRTRRGADVVEIPIPCTN